MTDVHIRSAVAGLRELGRAGVRTLAIGARRSAAGRWSRHAVVRALGPDSAAEPAAFAAAISKLAVERGPLIVYPGQEAAIDALLDAALPAEARLPYPEAEPVRRLRDKRALAALAEEAAGVPVPRTLAEGPAGELAAAPPTAPAVIKPARPGGALDSAAVVESRTALRAFLEGLPPAERVLVQELARGPLVGLALVVDRDGTVVARFQQVARRTWPPAAGGSSLAVGVAPDERLVERGARLLAGAGYWGLAQLQFLTSERGPALIDVNPRFYGSQPLALASGVNLAAAWHAVAVDAPRPPLKPYRVGVSYRRLESDLAAASHGAPRALLSRPPAPRAGAVWAADDPVPSALLAADSVLVPLRRRLRRLAGRGGGPTSERRIESPGEGGLGR